MFLRIGLEEITALFVCHTWVKVVIFGKILMSVQINDVHSHKWMKHMLIHL